MQSIQRRPIALNPTLDPHAMPPLKIPRHEAFAQAGEMARNRECDREPVAKPNGC